ncbi:MAG: glycosyltransferase family A protein [Fermentimonas sp.]|nr:glycosyltransferase family A protein [Fermentimonas sp.]
MEQKLVSIIIPAYNAEKYIEEAVKSALASTYSNFEIVIVNDGSTDTTQEIIDTLASQYPAIRSYTQSNAGASAARNHAISKAKGFYILPLDSDNYISPDYVEEAVKVLEAEPDVKLVSCEAKYIGEKSGRWKFKPFSLNLLCRKNLIDNCAMYRKADWEKVGGYCESILGREDWDFWLSLFETGGEFVRLPIVGLYYRVRSNSKRVQTRHLHKTLIDTLNARHKPLFFKELNGKLYYQRTYSKMINKLINWFKPQHVYVEKNALDYEKFVYAANEPETVKDFIKVPRQEIRYIGYEEKRFHIPGTKIKKSKAMSMFEPTNKSHIGYYEEQISLFKLRSYLVLRTA